MLAASSGQMVGLCFPRRSPSPLLSPRRRLLPRCPAARPRGSLPRWRCSSAASPPPPSADSAVGPCSRALHPVCFAVISSPCCSYSSSCAAVTVEAGQNACARYHFVGISPAPRSERRRFVAIFFRLRLCCYINAGRPRFSLPGGGDPFSPGSDRYHPFYASGVSNRPFGYGEATYFRPTFNSMQLSVH